MNHTPSGAIAVGAPHSRARYAAESGFARNSTFTTLMLTEEGNCILGRFAATVGCDFALMLEYEKDHSGSIAEWLSKHSAELLCFLLGLEFAAHQP